VGLTDWNWLLPRDPQDNPWDCSANSLSWCLRTIGRSETEYDVIRGLGPTRISPSLGLLDASGAGLVEYLGELGIGADNNPHASWGDVMAAAGSQPMTIGGRRWSHWVAVRLGADAARAVVPMLALMNGADGYMGVGQYLDQEDFARLGPFSAVWFTDW